MNKNNKGFSLIEFVIYFGILAAVSILVVNLMINAARDKGHIEARTEVQQNLRYGMLRITQAIHQASSVNGTPGATLSLVIGGVNNVFDLSSGVLRIKVGAAAEEPITSDKVTVTGLTFTKISNASPAKDTIQTSMTISYKDNGNTQLEYSQSQQSTAGLK